MKRLICLNHISSWLHSDFSNFRVSFGGIRPSRHSFRTCLPIWQRIAAKKFSSVVQAEVEKFNALATKWWDLEGDTRPLHEMNPVRIRLIREHLRIHGKLKSTEPAKPFLDLTAVDIGCGGGILSESLARLGAIVLGVDAAPGSIAVAQMHARKDPNFSTNLVYECVTAESLAASGKMFDIVCALEILEHVENVEGFLNTICQLVKPGGFLFLSTINDTWLSRLLCIFMAEDILKLVPQGTHEPSRFVSPKRIEDALNRWNSSAPVERNSGLVSEESELFRARNADGKMHLDGMLGMMYLPHQRRWIVLDKFINCNYFVAAQKIPM